MAEATALRNNALPYPVYGAPWTVVFPMLDADGDLVTGASTPDAEVSKNGDTFADCTNESTEIATTSGMYYLTLTGTEMTADVVAVIAKSATAGMKTTPIVLYPRKLVSIRANTSTSGGSVTSTILLDASASAVDDYYNGMICVAVIDSLTEVRMISDYTGSSKTATVVPDWNVAPDNNDTFTIYLPEGRQLHQADVTVWNGTAVASPNTAGYPVVTIKDGTGTGEIDTSSGGVLVSSIATGAITAASIAADAITDAKVAADVTIASVTGSVGSVTGAVGSVTGNVGGNVTGSVGSVVGAVGSVTGSVASVTGAVGSVTGNVGGNVTGTIGGLTTAAIADFFDTNSGTTYASAVAGSVVKEIASNSGDATAVLAAIDNLPTNAELATALGTADDATLAAIATVDTVVDAIKLKTDSLTFTVANVIDANIQRVNDVTVTGTGAPGDTWGP